ncbi:MAG: hypothetical protein U0230_09895 [Polyangiales bacterium]
MVIDGRHMSHSVAECAKAIETSGSRSIGEEPSASPANEVLATYRIRRTTAQVAGPFATDFDAVLEVLASCERDERILLCPFVDDRNVFLVFVRESGEALLGCICVPRRDRDPESDAT